MIYSSLNKNLHHFILNYLRKLIFKMNIQVIEIYDDVDFVINYKNLPGCCFLKNNNIEESNKALHEHFTRLFLYVLYNLDYNAPFEEHHIEFIKNLNKDEQHLILNELNDLKFLEEYCIRFFKYGN